MRAAATALARLLLGATAFLALAVTSVALIVLEEIAAKPLRWVNVRALALLRALHESGGA